MAYSFYKFFFLGRQGYYPRKAISQNVILSSPATEWGGSRKEGTLL